MGLNPKGRNWGDLVNWDSLGKFYAAFIIIWTVTLYSGVAWLVWKRKLLFVRMRNLPLAVAAVSFLHVYLVKIFLAYTTNGHFTCRAEFWIMSIYLPFGIALFQANLSQLRSISEQQQQLISPTASSSIYSQDSEKPRRSLRQQWHSLSHLHKTYFLIGVGMLVQLLVTGILYSTSPTLQGDWSSYGNIPHRKGQAKCRESGQWAASAFWQLFYSWCYGPYLLYKIRNINDTHHWRLQVILSVIAGLPGSPLWLAAVYTAGTAWKEVNRWWVPPMWLAPGIIVMQAVTIFFPIFEAVQSRHDMRDTLSTIKGWEDSRNQLLNSDTARDSQHTSDKHFSSLSHNSTVSSTRQAQMHSMAGFEKALTVNPTPLLRFAATRDFTAENITFLLSLRQWRGAWASNVTSSPEDEKKQIPDWARTHLFAAATDIYISFINERTASFPLNLESKVRADLNEVFSRAVPERSQHTHNPVSTFRTTPPHPVAREYSSDSTSTLQNPPLSTTRAQPVEALPNPEMYHEPEFPHHPGVQPLGKARSKISEKFDERVFDAAEQSIKYLVLTNTWQKFVKASRGIDEVSVEGG